MKERPALDAKLSSRDFRDYYYLKEELVRFCRENGLPAGGGKPELTERIACFLDGGKISSAASRKRAAPPAVIDEDTLIGENFVCSEKHRAFFKSRLGSGFTFKVDFMKWLRSNPDKTCGDALSAYAELAEARKAAPTVIDRQFEYNTYIRAFFADNKGKTLADAIKCWKHKKALPGHNRYERSDLAALEP